MKPSKILFVDDDSNLLSAFQRNYRGKFNFDVALGGEEALRLVEGTPDPYAVVLADMNMPGLNGVQLLERVRTLAPGSVRMMLTGNADQQTAVDAVNRGSVFRFLNKPCPPDVLTPAIEAALQEFQLRQMERDVLEGTVTGSIKVLTEVLGMVAPEALGRGQRLRDSMARFARWLKLDSVWELEVAALLSPIGMAVVPPVILRKLSAGTELSPGEAQIVRRVPRISHDLLADIPRLRPVAEILLYQEQRFDGTGYPTDGRIGPDLPLGSRLLKILADRLVLEGDGVARKSAYKVMRLRTGMYDLELLEQSFVCFESFLAHAISPTQRVVPEVLAQLRSGDVIVSDLSLRNGVLLVRAGTVLSPMSIERIGNFTRLGEIDEPFLIQPAELRASHA